MRTKGTSHQGLLPPLNSHDSNTFQFTFTLPIQHPLSTTHSPPASTDPRVPASNTIHNRNQHFSLWKHTVDKANKLPFVFKASAPAPEATFVSIVHRGLKRRAEYDSPSASDTALRSEHAEKHRKTFVDEKLSRCRSESALNDPLTPPLSYPSNYSRHSSWSASSDTSISTTPKWLGSSLPHKACTFSQRSSPDDSSPSNHSPETSISSNVCSIILQQVSPQQLGSNLPVQEKTNLACNSILDPAPGRSLNSELDNIMFSIASATTCSGSKTLKFNISQPLYEPNPSSTNAQPLEQTVIRPSNTANVRTPTQSPPHESPVSLAGQKRSERDFYNKLRPNKRRRTNIVDYLHIQTEDIQREEFDVMNAGENSGRDEVTSQSLAQENGVKITEAKELLDKTFENHSDSKLEKEPISNRDSGYLEDNEEDNVYQLQVSSNPIESPIHIPKSPPKIKESATVIISSVDDIGDLFEELDGEEDGELDSRRADETDDFNGEELVYVL